MTRDRSCRPSVRGGYRRRPSSDSRHKYFRRRWHISLSTWYRDYLYIPLGGSRRGPGRTYLNLLIIFALVINVVANIGSALFGIGMLITAPIAMCAYMLAFDTHRAAIEAAAAADGVTL